MGSLPPDYEPTDPGAPDVLIIAQVAVSEYNKQKKTSLTLVSVLKAEKQVFAGVSYRLVISAREKTFDKPNNYLTVVYAQAAPTSVQLVSFDPLLL